MADHTMQELLQMQSLPLEAKISMTRTRIKAWINEFGEDGVYISFSGGKDSTVLLDLIRNECGYKNIPAVFVDVPTQYPELRDFAKTFKDVEILKPKISFMEVCERYGFPLISKEVALYVQQLQRPQTEKNANTRRLRLYGIRSDGKKATVGKLPVKYMFLIDAPFKLSNSCCDVMKKQPLHKYGIETGRKPFTATMASESRARKTQWLSNGCNAFNLKYPISNPMSFWTEQDILKYIRDRELPICSVYGKVVLDYEALEVMEGQSLLFETGNEILKTTGCDRTGCMLCGFGCCREGDTRFLQLKQTHPKMYNLLDVVKNNGITFREAIEWTNKHGNLDIKL